MSLSVCPVTVQPGSHPSSPHLYSRTKETFWHCCKSTLLLQAMPLPLLLFSMSLSFLAILPTKPQDDYGSASRKHTSTSFLNPAFSFSLLLSFCLSLSRSFSLFLHCWRTTYCSCHQGSVGVWLIERACVRVSVDGHLGLWPSSWILSLLLNGDSLPPSLPLSAVPA